MNSSSTLVIGAGGREHALARRLARDPEAGEVLLAPGNPGAARRFRCLPVAESDPTALIDAARREAVSLAVIGPEAPLAAGLADALDQAGVRVFGPSQSAARLESSKWFAKQIMTEAGVPTARAECHAALRDAESALARFASPWVLKADGLAAGKGVCVTVDRDEAYAFLAACLEGGKFGASGRSVVIEEFLSGEEASVMAVCDGARFALLPPARDYKRALDHDLGPNTGGMGAYAPAAHVTGAIEALVGSRIVAPLLAAMAARGAPFRGLLYCGLMIGPRGASVVEFNVRFGDPETQVVLPLIEGSLHRLLESAARGALVPDAIRRKDGAAVTVALVDQGYPGGLQGKGSITGLDQIEHGDVSVIHAGGAWKDGAWAVRGGRSAYVVGEGRDREQARARCYQAVDRLGGAGWRCRRDIAAGGNPGGRPAAAASAGRRAGG